MSNEAATGRPCPDCQSPMTDLRSLNARMCTNGRCQAITDWNLSPGQRPLLGSNRTDRKEHSA